MKSRERGGFKSCPVLPICQQECQTEDLKSYLQWMIDNLRDTDFHEWSLAAQKVISTRAEEDAPIEDLEQQADEILRDAGYL